MPIFNSNDLFTLIILNVLHLFYRFNVYICVSTVLSVINIYSNNLNVCIYVDNTECYTSIYRDNVHIYVLIVLIKFHPNVLNAL
ncbi:hypothetical protein C2G38_2054197, partial [Gigaspora rosea]